MIQGKARSQRGNQRQTRESLHLTKEVRTIQHRAAEHDGRIVSIGPLVFFSTDTGIAVRAAPRPGGQRRLLHRASREY